VKQPLFVLESDEVVKKENKKVLAIFPDMEMPMMPITRLLLRKTDKELFSHGKSIENFRIR
jgi:hypothetical protein